MVFKKKGQAALEFLTTYGWAFLIILVMIGALAYFGVLDPSNFAAERCVAKTPLTCDGQNFIIREDNASVSLRNGLNEDILLANAEYRTGSSNWTPCANTLTVNATIPGSRTGTLNCSFTENLTHGQRERLEIRYTECSGSDIPDCSYGRLGDIQLYANVQESTN